MCEGNNSSGLRFNWQKTSKRNYCGSRTSVMEFESDWTKHRKSSAYTAQVIRSATSFMPWSCRIPIGEGYHEFL
ncbi:F-box/kelch-repeat protein isoform B [Senna tora]|uniref:F-box/kelch-repeat protein isoform B n=1 Tax=Senna tora TaxID=362788 RepID=A0A834TB78_9FABA|nr:F-box/kelch-repeat protein isoform B [Senna tora]